MYEKIYQHAALARGGIVGLPVWDSSRAGSGP